MDRLDGANPFTSLPSARWNDVYLTRCANLGYLTEFSKEFVYEFYSCHLCAVGWFPEIAPQSLLIYADHFQNIKVLGEALEKMDPEWSVFTHYCGMKA